MIGDHTWAHADLSTVRTFTLIESHLVMSVLLANYRSKLASCPPPHSGKGLIVSNHRFF